MRVMLASLAAGVLALSAAACSGEEEEVDMEETMEDMGDDMEETAEEMEDDMEDMADDMEE